MRTRKTTFRTNTQLTTSMADLGSIIRFNFVNNNTFTFSFVLDEKLQLKETPIAYPIVHNLSPVLFPNSFEVFHNNLVSIKIGNNIFTDIVVNPSHPTSFSSREFFKQSLAGTSAFGLKFTTQELELPFDLLDFGRIIKPTVRTDSEVIYSEVNAQNGMLRATALLNGSNLFRECEEKEASTFFINSEEALCNFPTEIFFVTSRDIEIKFLPYFKQSQNKLASFDVCTPWKIISDRRFLDDWLRFSFLNNSTSLFNTCNSKLRWESSLSQGFIDKRMELDIIFNLMFPCLIDTELKTFSMCSNSSNYLFSWIDFNFCSDSCSHKDNKTELIYKASPPTAKAVGIRSGEIL